MGYSGPWGKLIHEKNLKLKISCQTPFNCSTQNNTAKPLYATHNFKNRMHLHCAMCIQSLPLTFHSTVLGFGSFFSFCFLRSALQKIAQSAVFPFRVSVKCQKKNNNIWTVTIILAGIKRSTAFYGVNTGEQKLKKRLKSFQSLSFSLSLFFAVWKEKSIEAASAPHLGQLASTHTHSASGPLGLCGATSGENNRK